MTRPGWVRVDCHLHTVASGDAVTTIDELAERARQQELDVVCVTDHNVTSAAVAAAERDIGVRIVIGEEIRTPNGDVIGLFLTERIPYVLPLGQVVSLIRGQGGLVYLPHPFDPGRSSLGAAATRLCAAGQADVVEVFNAKIEDQARNEQAAELAARYGLAGLRNTGVRCPSRTFTTSAQASRIIANWRSPTRRARGRRRCCRLACWKRRSGLIRAPAS